MVRPPRRSTRHPRRPHPEQAECAPSTLAVACVARQERAHSHRRVASPPWARGPHAPDRRTPTSHCDADARRFVELLARGGREGRPYDIAAMIRSQPGGRDPACLTTWKSTKSSVALSNVTTALRNPVSTIGFPVGSMIFGDGPELRNVTE